MSRTSIARTLLFATTSGLLAAQTVVVVPCSQDNTLFESATGSLSSGAGEGLYVGVTGQTSGALRRALLRFDVAGSVPAGAFVLDATLTVRVDQSSFVPPSTMFVHRVLQDWGEGTSVSTPPGGGGGGAPATAGDATWVHTFWPSSSWSSPGGDFDAVASGAIPTPSSGLADSMLSADLVRDVQSFLDDPGQNFGWLLKTDETTSNRSVRLDSREISVGTAPSLRVTYITSGQAASVGQGCLVGGQAFAHAWSAAPIGGSTVQLTLSHGPTGGLAANMLSLGFDPVGSMIGAPCLLHLPVNGFVGTHSLIVLDGSGNGAAPFAVPAGFPGVHLVSQGAAIASSPAGFVLSNAVVAQL